MLEEISEYVAIKAVGDWELEVRAIPFDDKDADGQYFDASTDIMQAQFSSPVVTYYHGIKQDTPAIIGKTARIEKRSDGWWARVILDKAQALAQKVWEAAKNGTAYASSGSIRHLARLQQNGQMTAYDKRIPGRIAVWPFAELAIFDTPPGQRPASWRAVAYPALKSVYEQAGIDWPDIDNPSDKGAAKGEEHSAAPEHREDNNEKTIGAKTMEENEIKALVQQGVEAAMKAQRELEEAAKKVEAEKQAAVDEAVKAERAEWEKEAAKNNRLPSAPYVAEFGDTWKYDNLSAGELGLVIDTMKSAGRQVSASAIKAQAIKLVEDKNDYGHRELAPSYSLGAMKAAGINPTIEAIKGVTDPLYTGGTTDGGNWVGTAYARELWGVIRAEAAIMAKLPSVVIPDGFASSVFPIEGTDPTWYGVSEASSADGTLKVPAATVTASQITTPTNVTLSVKKVGARVMYTGEMTEDSLIAFVPQLRNQLITSGKEQIEHLVIDGDTTTTAYTNINDIGNSSAVTAGTLFLQLDGLRHYALTNLSRAGGALSEDDYLETMWKLGTAGIGGADMSKCGFVIDPNVYKKSLQMATVKTKDVWTQATMESGVLTKMWGYSIFPSWFMHFKSATRKSNSAGKVDQTTVGNNTYGALLAVRWDQWKLGYKRQMTIETTRIANADAWEIVALARLGLAYRDTSNAAAVTYGLTV